MDDGLDRGDYVAVESRCGQRFRGRILDLTHWRVQLRPDGAGAKPVIVLRDYCKKVNVIEELAHEA